MMALVEAARARDYPAEIVPSSPAGRRRRVGLGRAQGLPALAIDHKAYASREAFDEAIDDALAEAGVDLVALAGFMRIQSAGVRAQMAGPAAQHPPLAAAACSRAASATAGPRRRACASRVARVHFVTEEMDAGPIIAQAAVPCMRGTREDALAERILVAEHRLYPQALSLVASGRARLEDGRVMLDAAD